MLNRNVDKISDEAMNLLRNILNQSNLDGIDQIRKSLNKPFKLSIRQSKDFPEKLQIGLNFSTTQKQDEQNQENSDQPKNEIIGEVEQNGDQSILHYPKLEIIDNCIKSFSAPYICDNANNRVYQSTEEFTTEDNVVIVVNHKEIVRISRNDISLEQSSKKEPIDDSVQNELGLDNKNNNNNNIQETTAQIGFTSQTDTFNYNNDSNAGVRLTLHSDNVQLLSEVDDITPFNRDDTLQNNRRKESYSFNKFGDGNSVNYQTQEQQEIKISLPPTVKENQEKDVDKLKNKPLISFQTDSERFSKIYNLLDKYADDINSDNSHKTQESHESHEEDTATPEINSMKFQSQVMNLSVLNQPTPANITNSNSIVNHQITSESNTVITSNLETNQTNELSSNATNNIEHKSNHKENIPSSSSNPSLRHHKESYDDSAVFNEFFNHDFLVSPNKDFCNSFYQDKTQGFNNSLDQMAQQSSNKNTYEKLSDKKEEIHESLEDIQSRQDNLE